MVSVATQLPSNHCFVLLFLSGCVFAPPAPLLPPVAAVRPVRAVSQRAEDGQGPEGQRSLDDLGLPIGTAGQGASAGVCDAASN